jgi:hypothetical protein
VASWQQERHLGRLEVEARFALQPKYTSTGWFGQPQPYQDVVAQYRRYMRRGYTDAHWKARATAYLATGERRPGVVDDDEYGLVSCACVCMCIVCACMCVVYAFLQRTISRCCAIASPPLQWITCLLAVGYPRGDTAARRRADRLMNTWCK